MIGFCFTSDWLRKWREDFNPIAKRSNAKPKQMLITFNTQVKTALNDSFVNVFFFFGFPKEHAYKFMKSAFGFCVYC